MSLFTSHRYRVYLVCLVSGKSWNRFDINTVSEYKWMASKKKQFKWIFSSIPFTTITITGCSLVVGCWLLCACWLISVALPIIAIEINQWSIEKWNSLTQRTSNTFFKNAIVFNSLAMHSKIKWIALQHTFFYLFVAQELPVLMGFYSLYQAMD